VKKHIISLTTFFLLLLLVNSVSGQVFSCKVDGKFFSGKITEAFSTMLGEENFIKIKAEADDKIIYLYCKVSALKGETPIELKYREHNNEKSETPDSEIIWVPEGPERPQWNCVEGESIVTQYDAESKTISGTFEFVVEKFQYSSRADKKRPRAEITNGIFSNIQYIIEEPKTE
jgi:hypothetical protein